MRKGFFFCIIMIVSLSSTIDAAPPKYEMRAVWLTTNWGLDWPSRPARNTQEAELQQQELCRQLDEVAAMGFNTVFFQARIRGEVFYNSQIEPWSAIVSGKSGRSPGYDPLKFAVTECHRRGLECHAWIITIPTGNIKRAQQIGNNSVPARNPELCVKLKGEWYLNPGNPQTAEYIASLATEIAYNYDVDGIHLDYIRYPDENGKFPDNDTYKQYAPECISLAEWRMSNITHIVQTVCDAVKSVDEAIMVSTAPLGHYTSIDGMPPTTWCCTGGVSQDVIQWLCNGDNDFVAPMIYYRDSNYFPYLYDWVHRVGSEGYVVAGLGAYRMESTEGNWSLDDIKHQIEASRQYNAGGQAFFRLQHLLCFTDLAHLLMGYYYSTPALIPPISKTNAPEATAVAGLTLHSGNIADTLVWNTSHEAIRYAVYASVTDSVVVDNSTHLVHSWVNDTTIVFPARVYKSFAVTAIDPFRRESQATYITPERKSNTRHPKPIIF